MKNFIGSFIPVRWNMVANHLNHHSQIILTEWLLLPTVFDEVYKAYRRLMVGLFATRRYQKLPIYRRHLVRHTQVSKKVLG